MRKEKVYIASPYSNGWQADNVRRQIEAKHILMDAGFIPFAPLENHFCEIFKHRPEHEWFEWDLEWLAVCDIVVRLRAFDSNGNEIPSTGADKEVQYAKDLGLTVYVFDNLEQLKLFCKEYI